MHVDSLHNGKQYITFLPEHASEDYSEINTSGIHAVDISNYGTFSQNRISPHQPLLEELDEKYAESLGNSGDFDIGHGSLVSEAAASYLSTSDKIKRWCSGYWPLIILPVAGVGIFFTAKEWTLGIEDLVEKCRESLEPITHEFAECLESFTQNNIANVIGGALAGTFAGAALQEIVKTPSGRRNEAGWRQRLEQFQTEGGFIIWLFLNYLYRGLWFNEERPRDWVRNLKLQEASIYAANGFLGMIVWHRITALESYEKERREQRRVENDSKPNWWLFCFTAFFLTVSLGFSESKTRRIVQELLMMANASVIGHLGMRRIKERADNGASLAEKTEHFLKVCYPLLPFVSYIFYEKFPSNYARLGSMASLGT